LKYSEPQIHGFGAAATNLKIKLKEFNAEAGDLGSLKLCVKLGKTFF
jgi:hypothetical protein